MWEFSFFNTHSWRTCHLLDTLVFQCIQIYCRFCVFAVREKSRDIVYQRTCWFSMIIFVQHGLLWIQLTAYSALLRLTNHGIYYIPRCGIWLLTIIHIPYIHFQRKLRKVTPLKIYLSFWFSIQLMNECHEQVVLAWGVCTCL